VHSGELSASMTLEGVLDHKVCRVGGLVFKGGKGNG